MITNIYTGGKSYQVKLNIQLELGSVEDSDRVEFALSQIMHSVLERVQATEAADFNKRDRIQALREALKSEIQKSVGRNRIHGVLFRSIQVM